MTFSWEYIGHGAACLKAKESGEDKAYGYVRKEHGGYLAQQGISVSSKREFGTLAAAIKYVEQYAAQSDGVRGVTSP